MTQRHSGPGGLSAPSVGSQAARRSRRRPASSKISHKAAKNQPERLFCPRCGRQIAYVQGNAVDPHAWAVVAPGKWRSGPCDAVGFGGALIRGAVLATAGTLAGAVEVARAFRGMVGRLPHRCGGGAA